MKNICVFASSSNELAPMYVSAANQLGEELAKDGRGIVFGAGADGLMGALARSAAANGGRLIGVVPDVLDAPGIVYEQCHEVLRTRTMRERKATMAELADALIALPGGFGTLEEVLEIITLKQLAVHNKPIALINTGGFYTHLLAQFREMVDQRFAAQGVLTLFGVFEDACGAMDYIKNYDPQDTYKKHIRLTKEG